MGKKGEKLTSTSNQKAEELLELLGAIDGVTAKRMFGGNGIFHDGKMFGMVSSKGEIFFKTNDSTKGEYLKKGAEKHSRMPYYRIPKEILASEIKLIKWAKQAIEISKKK